MLLQISGETPNALEVLLRECWSLIQKASQFALDLRRRRKEIFLVFDIHRHGSQTQALDDVSNEKHCTPITR
jgi:hypothetical protein